MTNESWRSIRAAEALGSDASEPEPDSVTGEVAVAGPGAWRPGAEALSELGVGVAVIEVDGVVSFANGALAAMLGRASDDLRDVAFVDLVDAAAAAAVRARLREAELGTPSLAPLPVFLRHAGRRKAPAEMTFRRLGAPVPGSPRRAVLAFVASTATRDEVRSLRSALGSALDAIRQRDDFFALAAHELRTPLTPLALHLQSTLRALDRDPGSVRRSLVVAESQVKRLGHLVDQLLDVARVRAGRLVIDKRETDLAPIVRDAAARFAGECVRAGSTIELACADPVIGQWDPMRVDQIVTNLVSNAVKHAPGSPIFVSLREAEDRAVLTVQDRGFGIAAGEIGRIFDRFERGGEATSRGAGLGLWIVRQLVEAHGGTIRVESEPGEGATFVVELPRS